MIGGLLSISIVAVCRGGAAPSNPATPNSLGEDKAYDTADHVANFRAICVTQNSDVTKTGKTCNSAINERTTRHPGYDMSQSRRATVECIFGWGKQHGAMGKTKHRCIARVATDFLLNLIACNLIRIPKLLSA